MDRPLTLCLLLLLAIADNHSAVNGDQEDKSEEVISDQQQNDTVSGEIVGIPDSHEAMNNRDMFSGNHKSKRSYEFLLGLVNNNSRYEVTRRDTAPTFANQQRELLGEETAEKPADELLKLITRIASHPNHWSRVHRLLRKIDGDLTRSKKLLHNPDPQHATTGTKDGNHQKAGRWSSHHRNHSSHHRDTMSDPWVSFRSPDADANTWDVFKSTTSGQARLEADRRDVETVLPFRRQFSYHKVTGKPLYVDRPSKAYIAVSIVAPKIDGRGLNEAELEKQLRKLKPWEQRRDSY